MSDFSRSALLTDLYEFTMAAAYFEAGVLDDFTFELIVRDLPLNRGFLVSCGLEQALEFLENFRVRACEIDYLRRLEVFRNVSRKFWEYLRGLRFEGSVRAIPEGTVAFALEPLLSLTAAAPMAQLVETYLVNAINFQTMVATKAARVVLAASRDGRSRPVVDFGARRAHSPQASVWAARAAYVGGCEATSNVYAGMRLGIPVRGTQAHSWVMSFPSEKEAFDRYARTFPDKPIMIIDTYDTLRAAQTACRIGERLGGVRIDSGDLLALSRSIRRLFDRGGLGNIRIIASGDLDEYRIARLVGAEAPIDAFGVGTRMVTSNDAPFLSAVYKLVERKKDGKTVYALKTSSRKRSYPGAKQVWRYKDKRGRFRCDLLALASERPQGASALLKTVMKRGRRVAPAALQAVRERLVREIASLDERFRRLTKPAVYKVRISAKLNSLYKKLRAKR